MMDAKDLEKNKLDLTYQKGLQKLNAAFALGTVGAVTVLASYVANPSALWQATAIAAAAVLIALVAYARTTKELNSIINKIDKLR